MEWWNCVSRRTNRDDTGDSEEREGRSRPYSELSTEVSPIRTDDIDTLRVARQEARDSLDKTIDAVEEKDSKAISTVRLNLLLVGLAITGVSSAPSAMYFANWFTIIGFSSLLVSTISGIWAYTYTDYAPGITADYLNELDSAEYSEGEWLRWMNQRYQLWIQTAVETDQALATYLGRTHILQIVAVGFLLIGVIAGLSGMGPVSVIPHGIPPESAGNQPITAGNSTAVV